MKHNSRVLLALIGSGIFFILVLVNWNSVKSFCFDVSTKFDSIIGTDEYRLVNKELFYHYTDQMNPNLESIYTELRNATVYYENSAQFLKMLDDSLSMRRARHYLLRSGFVSKAVTEEVFFTKIKEWLRFTGKKLSNKNQYYQQDHSLQDYHEDEAIALAKNSFLFCENYRKCDSLNNDTYIKTSLANKKGIITSKGWKAKKVGIQVYLVTYFYEEDEELFAYALEVNLPIEGVRNVFANKTLEDKYWNVNQTEF